MNLSCNYLCLLVYPSACTATAGTHVGRAAAVSGRRTDSAGTVANTAKLTNQPVAIRNRVRVEFNIL